VGEKSSYGNKNFKATIPNTGGDRSKTAVECGKFKLRILAA
jgi:hypothetical protein